MIKSNLMPPLSKKTAAGKQKGKAAKKSGKSFYILLILILAGFIYYKQFGIPKSLRDKLPEKVIAFLGLTEPEPEVVMQAPREIPVPKLKARGFSVIEPVVPVNASVEEMVITLRPDVYFKNKDKLILKEKATPWPKELQLALDSRVCLKDAFPLMLNTFYDAAPDGMGYLDLVYQAPNYYFARVVTIDANTRNSFINNLRAKGANLKVIDTVSYRNGNVEFSMQGSIRLPSQQQLNVVPHSKMNSEILALRSLAVVNSVRLEGLESPIEEDFGLYRIVVLKTITEADYPSLLNFADALQKSNISIGIQKFVSSPLEADKMQSAIEFVMYVK
ncbi:MAG: hypothetical protein LBC64_07860 [Fibromonadaceae bacterium]|jgi:hypothetical protein|nr:hypothetical protein [Fibromonadaceae bacterium]